MADLTFGEVDWNDPEVDSGNSGPRTEFMRLDQGNSVVRVMGQPIKFYVNWVDTAEGKRRKVNTPIEDSALVDRLEEAGFKRSTRWLLKVLDRSDDTFKLLEVGPQIFKGIRDLVQNPKWGKVTSYDVTIKRGPKGQQPLYNVSPDPKEALATELQGTWKNFNENLNVERLITPSDPAHVYELMGWASGGSSESAEESTSTEAGGTDGVEFSFD